MLNLLGPSYTTIAKAALSTPGATVHLYGKGDAKPGRKMGHLTVVAGSMSEAEYRIAPLLSLLDESSSSSSPSAPVSTTPSHPLIAIIMGSDSDLPVMKPAAHILKSFSVPFELTIVSAHRTPHRLVRYAEEAQARGFKAIIAGAGGAAHLPGMTAAHCTIPVIGVPVKGSVLDGVDSLHSIVQMPRGIPVATVAINNSTNAALLALRVLAAEDSPLGREVRKKLEKYTDDMEKEVQGKIEKLETGGWEDYVYKK